MIILINKKDGLKRSELCLDNPKKVFIGRGSIFGNPFVIGRDGDRDQVIEKYRRYLWIDFQRNGDPSKFIRQLAIKAKLMDIILECFCAPKRCHGDVIVSAVNWLKEGGVL